MATRQIEVESYAGYKADERPLRFRAGEHWLRVVEILEQWYTPGSSWFRLRASDGAVYVLRRANDEDGWALEEN